MMNSWNAIGRIVQATYKKTATSSFVKFSLAVKRQKQKGEAEAKTDFIPCTIFGHIAEYFNNYLEKGDLISVSGSIQSNSYEKNGQQLTVIEAFVIQVALVNKPVKVGAQQPAPATQPAPPVPQQVTYQPPQVYQAPPQQPVQHCPPTQQPAVWPEPPPENLPFDIYGL